MFVAGHLRALVPGRRQPHRLRQAAAVRASRTASRRAVDGQVHKQEIAAGAVDQGTDRRAAPGTDDEIPFPIAAPDPLQRGGGAPVDQLRWRDEPGTAPVDAPTAFAQRSTGAQPLVELPAQAAPATVVERLVDRLVAHMPAGPVGECDPQTGRDLLRTPLLLEPDLHLRAQQRVVDQPGPQWPTTQLPRTRVRQVAVVAARSWARTLRRSPRLTGDGARPIITAIPAPLTPSRRSVVIRCRSSRDRNLFDRAGSDSRTSGSPPFSNRHR